ncbi:ParA family protein [Candidatus Woesearchaeota archaeon]|nr:ParA family protein [Nanoarchaeota archaeon]MCB9370922.1 ParA family protein [Candidatus Woesearchaeota archaeon]USN44023.1 MAG: ParA family protein [Candidatus Woesearchaeota archaeon]
MAKVICVKISKGGVGKTTLSSNLGAMLAKKGFRVLLIDLDSQANLSRTFVRKFEEGKYTSSHFLGDGILDLNLLRYNVDKGLDIIVSDIGLQEVAKFLEGKGNYYRRLHELLESKSISEEYDFVLLDLSPGVADSLTQMALFASSLLVSPVHFDTDSLSGLVLTINDISALYESGVLERDLKYLVVPNRYDRRFAKDNETIMKMIYENLEKEFIAEPIRENSHIRKARMLGMSAVHYELAPERAKEHRRAVEDFDCLAQKVLEMVGVENRELEVVSEEVLEA